MEEVEPVLKKKKKSGSKKSKSSGASFQKEERTQRARKRAEREEEQREAVAERRRQRMEEEDEPMEQSGGGSGSGGGGGIRKVSSFGSFLKSGGQAPGAGRYEGILAGLTSGDDSEVLISVQELSNMLLHAANEEALRGLDQGKYVAALLALLDFEHNGEIMLLAVRALCGLMEALPPSCAAIIGAHGVEALCAKLLMITYVDVAEECIKGEGMEDALHRLAMEAPGAVLRDGGLAAVLAYLDFFAVAVQRKAVEAAAHMCRGATAELRAQVEGSLDALLRLLEYEDGQVAARAMEALALVAEHWASSAELAGVLFQGGRTSEALLRILSDPALPHWSRAVRALQLGCAASPAVLAAALQQGLAPALAAAYSAERAPEVLQLVAELFPPLPPDAAGPSAPPPPAAAVAAGIFGRPSKKGAAPPAAPPAEDPRASLMAREAQLFGNVLGALLPLLVRAHAEAASVALRSRAVLALARAVLSAPLPLLAERRELAPFLARLLREQGPEVLPGQALALCCARRLLSGLPEPFAREMRREGLAWAVVGLAERLRGAEESGEGSAAFCAALCRDPAFAGEPLGDSDEERALREAAASAGAAPAAFVALLQARPPSAWELKRAQVAERLAALSVREQQGLWDHLEKRPEVAQALVDGLLQHCADELLAAGNGAASDDPLDPGLAVKIMMQPLPIALRPGGSAVLPAWPDSGGAAVEPLTRMSRLSDFVWERIDAAASRPASAASGDSDAGGGGEEEDEFVGMDENEFREWMAGRVGELAEMEPEPRARQLERLKRAIGAFAAASRRVPELEPGDDEGVPEEEARQLREAATRAREELRQKQATRPQLRFRLGPFVARPDQTLYAFLAQALALRGRALWGAVPMLEYFAADEAAANASATDAPVAAPRPASELALGVLHRLHAERGCGLRFLSSRLTGAVAACTRDLLACAAGAIPEWAAAAARAAPWLLPLATRRELLEKSAYGALACIADLPVVVAGKGYSYDGQQSVFQFGRLPRAKVRVKRDHVWASCRAAMKLYAGVRSTLEVEYYGEQGVGLGPTLEFWTLVSRDMQLRSLNLWLDTAAPSDPAPHCNPAGPGGLFPRPSKEANAEWALAGTVMAKAMLDGRLLDLPLSPLFWHLMLDLQPPLGLDALRHVYPEAHAVLAELSRGAQCKYDPADLGLCMTLVGRDDWELLPGGASIPLTRENAAEYVRLSLEALLGAAGHAPARAAFAEGWSRVFPLGALRLLTPDEITQCLCGDSTNYSDEMWSVENLRRTTRAEHGYDSSSRIVGLLHLVLATRFSLEDRKAFLRFATGSPRLPLGGFAALAPRLTVVEKSDPGRHPDESLPSVMTCVNYLKLPCYSSVEILEMRLRTAMSEGVSGFFLS